MALVRVYCGLASAQQSGAPVPAVAPLTAAVVDDAGRLLDLCEIGDEPSGYARLAALLAERSNGSTGVAIAADNDEHLVTSLFNAAGRPLAFADDDAVDDYAERFADDESTEEIESPQVVRRAVGLARALQAGALSAVVLTTPRDLAGYKPVLSAHGALINGRQAAAVALREVLRELYPAALRAYPDPAEPISLAVLDALPEPGLLNGSGGRAREAAATEAIAARLANKGVADSTTLTEAITALRVAASETPRRSGASKVQTAAIAETVRQAVAAVRACDAACETLVGTLAGRVSAPSQSGRRTARRGPRPETPAESTPQTPAVPVREPVTEAPAARQPITPPRRARQQAPAAQDGPTTPPTMAPPPVTPPPITPRPVAPAAGLPTAPQTSVPGIRVPTPPPLRRPVSAPPRVSPVSAPPPVSPSSAPPVPAAARFDDPPARPVSSPPPPPGITPIVPSQRGGVTPADAGEPFRPTLTAAAINSARAQRQQRAVEARRQSEPGGVDAPPPPGINAADVSIPVPASRPTPPEPGSRANWPLVNSTDERPSGPAPLGGPPAPLGFAKYGDKPGSDVPSEPSQEPGRVTPPWQANDLPPEPPMLRLVEPPSTERLGRPSGALTEPTGNPLGPSPLDRLEPPRLEPPSLRLVEPDGSRGGALRVPEDLPPAPVSAEDDGDLLIFAATRSAWFTGQTEAEDQIEWTSSADDGWRAAEQAAKPAVGAETNAGLPKRVPQANLVPGSPLREERPLRIVRDPASIAAHTTGYFRGWRRGQEIGGYAVGGRPGREAAGGWDFSRDAAGTEQGDFDYRPAYRSS